MPRDTAGTVDAEAPVLLLAAPAQLVFTPEQTSARLGGLISAYKLRQMAARGETDCTYIAGHLGFTEEHMRTLIAKGERDGENYGRPKAA